MTYFKKAMNESHKPYVVEKKWFTPTHYPDPQMYNYSAIKTFGIDDVIEENEKRAKERKMGLHNKPDLILDREGILKKWGFTVEEYFKMKTRDMDPNVTKPPPYFKPEKLTPGEIDFLNRETFLKNNNLADKYF